MSKQLQKTRFIEISGWLVGLITATLFNYYVIPIVTNKTGQMLISIMIGLVIGLFLMFICVTASQYLANVHRKQYGTPMPDRKEVHRKTKNRSNGNIKKTKYSQRLIIVFISSFLVLALMSSLFTVIMLAGISARVSPALIIGLILGLIIIIFVVAKVSPRVVKVFYNWYKIFSLEKQRYFRRFLYTCLLIIPLVLVGIFTLYGEVFKPQQSVAQVRLENGSLRKITAQEFLQRLHYEQEKQLKKAASNDNSEYKLGFAGTILDRMTHEILVREQAEKRNLKVSEAEIDQQISKAEPVSKTHSGTPPPIPRYGLTMKQFRENFHLEILGQKLREAFFHDISVEQEQVRLKLIRFESEEDARKAVSPIWGDTAFSKLYDQITKGSAKSVTGMIRDWSTVAELEHDYNPDFSKIAFLTTVGGCFPQPVLAEKGWYLADVLGHEKRTMTEEWRKQKGDDAFQKWLDNQQARITQFPVWMKLVPIPPGSGATVPNAEPLQKSLLK